MPSYTNVNAKNITTYRLR